MKHPGTFEEHVPRTILNHHNQLLNTMMYVVNISIQTDTSSRSWGLEMRVERDVPQGILVD